MDYVRKPQFIALPVRRLVPAGTYAYCSAQFQDAYDKGQVVARDEAVAFAVEGS